MSNIGTVSGVRRSVRCIWALVSHEIQERGQTQFDVAGCKNTVECARFKVLSQVLNRCVELPQLGEVAINVKPCALLGGEIGLGCPAGRGVLEQVQVPGLFGVDPANSGDITVGEDVWLVSSFFQ